MTCRRSASHVIAGRVKVLWRRVATRARLRKNRHGVQTNQDGQSKKERHCSFDNSRMQALNRWGPTSSLHYDLLCEIRRTHWAAAVQARQRAQQMAHAGGGYSSVPRTGSKRDLALPLAGRTDRRELQRESPPSWPRHRCRFQTAPRGPGSASEVGPGGRCTLLQAETWPVKAGKRHEKD